MESVKQGKTIILTPKWFIGLRVVQIVISLAIVGLAGSLIHGFYADPLGLAIAAGIFTWITAVYAILTEHVGSCQSGYNTWAILSLDFFMIVLWLASLGSNAAFRSAFTVNVNVGDCYDDGSAVDATQCEVYKRDGAVANQTGLAELSAVAGLSALMFLLFIATFAYVAHFFRLEWAKYSTGNDAEKANTTGATTGVASNVHATAPGADHSQPFLNNQQQQQQYQQQWAQAQPPTSGYSAAQNVSYDQNNSYAAHNTTYTSSTQDVYNQTTPPHQTVQNPYSPHGTPAPSQPYYPPQ